MTMMQKRSVTQGLWVSTEVSVTPAAAGPKPCGGPGGPRPRLLEVRSSPALLGEGRRTAQATPLATPSKNEALSRFDAILERHSRRQNPQSPRSPKLPRPASGRPPSLPDPRGAETPAPGGRRHKDPALPEIDTSKFSRHIVDQLMPAFAKTPDRRKGREAYTDALEQLCIDDLQPAGTRSARDGTRPTISRARSERGHRGLATPMSLDRSGTTRFGLGTPSVGSAPTLERHDEPVLCVNAVYQEPERWDGIIDRIQARLDDADVVLARCMQEEAEDRRRARQHAEKSKWTTVRKKLGLEAKLDQRDASMLNFVERKMSVVILNMCEANRGSRLSASSEEEEASASSARRARPGLALSRTIGNMQELISHLGPDLAPEPRP